LFLFTLLLTFAMNDIYYQCTNEEEFAIDICYE